MNYQTLIPDLNTDVNCFVLSSISSMYCSICSILFLGILLLGLSTSKPIFLTNFLPQILKYASGASHLFPGDRMSLYTPLSFSKTIL